MHGQLLGTPGFMAPEQAGGLLDQIDQRTDVYGLGAVLYEILTGDPPFTGKKTMEILHQVCHELPRSPRELNPTLDPALQAICLKALSKPREQRYASATELAQDVQRYLADEPVHACPDPWTRRALRWARRHRTAVATAAGLLVTSTIALGVGTVLVTRERNEAKLQGKQARQAVDDMYTKVAENWLEDRLDPLQKEFLEKTLAHYQTLTGQAAGDPAVRLEHGRAFQRMGDISLRTFPTGPSSVGNWRAPAPTWAAFWPSRAGPPRPRRPGIARDQRKAGNRVPGQHRLPDRAGPLSDHPGSPSGSREPSRSGGILLHSRTRRVEFQGQGRPHHGIAPPAGHGAQQPSRQPGEPWPGPGSMTR